MKSGLTVWITGASSGIGEALAEEYAKQGARLILSARRGPQLKQLAARLENARDHKVVPLDVSQTDGIPEQVELVLNELGKIDILVNNAGISQRAKVEDTTLEMDRRLFEVNFFGAVALTRALLPTLIQNKGKIVVISSVTGKVQTPGRSAYCASKHALQGWFDALRCEVWRKGVHVLLVTPGFIKTNLSFAALEADGTARNRMDKNQQKGMDVNKAAKGIIRAEQNNREEYYVGGFKEHLAIKIKRFLPRLYSVIAKRLPYD
ncbi:MAG: SDR family oxidoreductase [bacterium]